MLLSWQGVPRRRLKRRERVIIILIKVERRSFPYFLWNDNSEKDTLIKFFNSEHFFTSPIKDKLYAPGFNNVGPTKDVDADSY